MKTQAIPADKKLYARNLYFQGWRIVRIAELLEENNQTVHSWKEREKWDEYSPLQRVESTLEARMVQLIAKEDKEGRDFKEIDLLGRQMERMARVHKYSETGKEADLNPAINNRNDRDIAPRKASHVKNDIGEENVQILTDAFYDGLFEYQLGWQQAGEKHRIRNILKSRQIGATWYFAREAFIDAITTGKNKIFMSASKAQAHIFRNYIVQFCLQHTGVELKGDPIVLPNGANLYFLGTNAKTAQGYHGDTYLDEYFWIHGFQEFRKVTSGMAMHKQWKQTYFSTPSSLTHEAYPFWSGDQFNGRVRKDKRVQFNISHEALQRGAVGGDSHWRQIVTIEDAIRGGCDLFDIDQLRLEYSEDEYNNLLMCQFMDDTQSIFPLSKMQTCLVDSWIVWRDIKPYAPRPIGDTEVWLGYDPNGNNEGGDGAGLVAMAPAKDKAKPHRIIEKSRFWGKDYEQQADEILEWCRRYNVTYIGIDTTGIGGAVAEIVEKKNPFVRRINYNPDLKFQLVAKALNVIDRGRLQFDAGDTDIVQAFMAVRRALTESQRRVTYVSGRNNQTGHAELAWATMHALLNEPAGADDTGLLKSIMEFSE